MWANNIALKCLFNGRLSVWQKSVHVPRNALSTTTLQDMLRLAKRPSCVTVVLQSSVQRSVLRRDFHISKCLRSDINLKPVKDVILFKYDNVKLHKVITLFGIVNYIMFMSISMNLYYVLTTPQQDEANAQSEFDGQGGSSYSSVYPEASYNSSEVTTQPEESSQLMSPSLVMKGLCVVTCALAFAVLGGTWAYCNHVVRYIVLLKGGQKVTVVSHGVFAKNRFRTFDLNQVSIRGNRLISSAVLLNTKGKYFSFILDKKGVYTNPQLFDATVGVPRDLRN